MNGKFNNKKGGMKKSKKLNNGYFAQNVKKFGKNFIASKRDDEIKRDAPRVFKDIAFCYGDVGSIGEYFIDKRFVNSLYQYALSMYTEYELTSKGLIAYMNSEAEKNISIDPRMGIDEMIKTKTKQAAAYSIIVQGLNNILNTLKMESNLDRLALYCHVCITLKQISIQLKDYRYVL